MREPDGEFAEVEYDSAEETLVTLTENDAKVIARALTHMNNYLVGEFNKISLTEGVSDFIVEAARAQYVELSTDLSKLHVELAQAFPVLRQPQL
jgi:hypothetical protein